MLLLTEGWSFHKRLRFAASTPLLHRCSASHNWKRNNSTDINSWKLIYAPNSADNFSKRLKFENIALPAAAWALKPSLDMVPLNPPWLEKLESLRNAILYNAQDKDLYFRLQNRCSSFPFQHVWLPATVWALEELQTRCKDLSKSIVLAQNAWIDLGAAFLERLCDITEQSLWELFNHSRRPGQTLLAHIGIIHNEAKEPIHEAYDMFVNDLLTSGYHKLLINFPVLGRLLGEITEFWLSSNEEMLRRIVKHRHSLEKTFSIPEHDKLSTIKLNLSDPHKGGRVVALLEFGSSKVIYKPKDMQLDSAYQLFIQRINQTSKHSPMRYLKIVHGEGYGFMEWVQHCLCTSDNELSIFYFNAGRLLAILYLLGCSDCHYENLIACGNQLVLIDTETLLEPDLNHFFNTSVDFAASEPSLKEAMRESVLHTGLLPHWLLAGSRGMHAFDISALGMQPPPCEIDHTGWIGLNSDGMMTATIKKPSILPTSLPVAAGSKQRLTDFIDELCDGFSSQMKEILQYKKSISNAIHLFDGMKRRMITRPTRVYSMIQQELLRPASLRSANAQGMVLENLCKIFILPKNKPFYWPMLAEEISQMESLDIPFFYHSVDSNHIGILDQCSQSSHHRIATGIEKALIRLRSLDFKAIRFQEQLVRGSILARNFKESSLSPYSNNHTAEFMPGANHSFESLNSESGYYDESSRLTNQIWDNALHDPKATRPEWLGIDINSDSKSFNYGLIGNSLYSGRSGIAVLFCRLALHLDSVRLSRNARVWQQRALSCIDEIDEIVSDSDDSRLFRLTRDQPLGLAGIGGLLISLLLIRQSGLPCVDNLMIKIIDMIRPERLAGDEIVDLTGGVAGLIGPLLSIGNKRAIKLAKICGERLIATQLNNGGWTPYARVSGQTTKIPLTGFSHGASGMAAALGCLAHATSDQRFTRSAMDALEYERSVFDTDRGNWPDFRRQNNPREFMISWCHGAAGIMLSRLILKKYGINGNRLDDEIESAKACIDGLLRQVATENKPIPSHLCCGLFGLTTLMRIAGHSNSTTVNQCEQAFIHHAHAEGYYPTFFIEGGSVTLPGLFTGNAGIALSLLEAAHGLDYLPRILSADLYPTQNPLY